VLTVWPRAYPWVAERNVNQIPRGLNVIRTCAFDVARDLAFRSRYLRALALPDRWNSWWVSAVKAGLQFIRKARPQVVWSTYPTATAHLIGHSLCRWGGVPWVADFRDPMAQVDYPEYRPARAAFRWIEYRTLRRCSRAIFTAPGAVELYRTRYPEIPRTRLELIENGYDDTSFSGLAEPEYRPPGSCVTLLHSGLVYLQERDPRALFRALAAMLREGELRAGELRIVLRAPGTEADLQQLIDASGVGNVVVIEGRLPYQEALSEMLAVDALLLLQGAGCNYQVPAKLYEYLRARRPILALTDPDGDSAAVLRAGGIDTIASLESEPAIRAALGRFLRLLREGKAPVASVRAAAAGSRRERTRELARVMESVVEEKARL
jgi:glycosyltransferase involved in cell wall biosynthesis